MDIASNLRNFQTQISGYSARLIAVSKTMSTDIIMEAYQAGQRDFGENRVQELEAKASALPKDIRWHMIGHLQSNKVRFIAPFVHLIHSVDSLKLLKEINKQGIRNDRVLSCLLQVHIAREETKFGFSEGELKELFQSAQISQLAHIKITGLMGMATFTPDQEQVRREFQNLRRILADIGNQYQFANCQMSELSMGMTSDYQTALEEGSTIVRVGTAIFGSRNIT